MKKYLSKILMSIIVFGIFLMPLSPTVNLLTEKNIEIQLTANIANAVVPYVTPTTTTPTPSDDNDVKTGCNILPTTWHKCFLLVVYYLIYVPLAFIAKLSAQILDFFIYYSIGDNAYRSNFVEKGWAAVRDIANIFFILALLYVAIQTILSLHSANTKKMVGMIILIALLINFSLFTTRIVIDASNILAKVFYNNIVPKKLNGSTITTPNYGGERSITVGLVSQFNPVAIASGGTMNVSGETGMFAITLIIAILLMGYMIYMFISIALIFVGRVVALWLCMIFSPIAFISYTVPFDIPGFGHKEWWKMLLENAFLAPLFIFFLYIVVMFGDFMKIVTYDTNATDDFGKMMKVIIPFAIIFILLMKAKKTAVTMSGEIGAGIMKAGAVVGGLALGGAALGGAALMRGTAGAFMKGASTGDTAASRMASNRAVLKDPNAGFFKKVSARAGLAQGWTQKTTGYSALQTRMGQKLAKDEHEKVHSSHARHDLDEAAKTVTHGGKTKWDDLTGEERKEAKRDIERKRVMRNTPGMEKRTWGQLSDPEKKNVDSDVDQNFAYGIGHADKTLIPDAKKKQGMGSTIRQSMVGGSFDVRNLSKVSANAGDEALVKFASGLTSVIGNAMRGSLKSTLGIEHGTGQKALFKDLGHTISEALKGAKMHVDLSHVGHVEKEDHKGGGHGGGGGAHH